MSRTIRTCGALSVLTGSNRRRLLRPRCERVGGCFDVTHRVAGCQRGHYFRLVGSVEDGRCCRVERIAVERIPEVAGLLVDFVGRPEYASCCLVMSAGG